MKIWKFHVTNTSIINTTSIINNTIINTLLLILTSIIVGCQKVIRGYQWLKYEN